MMFRNPLLRIIPPAPQAFRRLPLLCCAAFLFLASCATNKAPQPGWFGNVRGYYDTATYLAQEGLGSTPEEAKTDALANLSRYITSTVSASLSASSKTSSVSSGTGTTTQVVDEVASDTSVQSVTDLKGVEFTDVYYYKPAKEYHVVCLLDRAKVFEQYEPVIELEKEKFYGYYNQAEALFARDPLLAIRYYSLARAESVPFMETLAYVRLFCPALVEQRYGEAAAVAGGIPMRITDAKVRSTLCFDVAGDHNGTVTNAVTEIFAAAGLMPAASARDARYTVTVSVRREAEEHEEGEFVLRVVYPSLALAVKNRAAETIPETSAPPSAAAGSSFAYTAKTARVSAFSDSVAATRAVTALAESLKLELPQVLENFLAEGK